MILALVSSVGFFWVHVHLGSNWSGTVDLMEVCLENLLERATHSVKDHTLTTTGPYRLARHPMYTVFFVYVIAVFLCKPEALLCRGFMYLTGTLNILIALGLFLNFLYAASRIRVSMWLQRSLN